MQQIQTSCTRNNMRCHTPLYFHTLFRYWSESHLQNNFTFLVYKLILPVFFLMSFEQYVRIKMRYLLNHCRHTRTQSTRSSHECRFYNIVTIFRSQIQWKTRHITIIAIKTIARLSGSNDGWWLRCRDSIIT